MQAGLEGGADMRSRIDAKSIDINHLRRPTKLMVFADAG